MSHSKVKRAWADIATMISNAESKRDRAKTMLKNARNELTNISTQFADEIAEANSYSAVSTDHQEQLLKSEQKNFTTEFTALQTALEEELDALGVSY